MTTRMTDEAVPQDPIGMTKADTAGDVTIAVVLKVKTVLALTAAARMITIVGHAAVARMMTIGGPAAARMMTTIAALRGAVVAGLAIRKGTPKPLAGVGRAVVRMTRITTDANAIAVATMRTVVPVAKVAVGLVTGKAMRKPPTVAGMIVIPTAHAGATTTMMTTAAVPEAKGRVAGSVIARAMLKPLAAAGMIVVPPALAGVLKTTTMSVAVRATRGTGAGLAIPAGTRTRRGAVGETANHRL